MSLLWAVFVIFLKSSSWKRSTDHKVNDLHDTFGANVFKSGCAIQPKNPYFVAKVQSKRRNQLYVPMDVVRDYKHEFPSTMSIRDSAGREFETRVVKWKDGRIWLVGGWRSFCRWNLVQKNDKWVCEFVREKSSLYLKVNIFHEEASAHPNKKIKK
ncbi:B3 domain-containing protein At5g60140-like [Capsicum annuum]|uniref:B3 domain-containing protein At5g60140-like n=1 Tax=Capsicum annuum TaxID=4072 RepID=UPI001FB081A3|nr:B3 domain-containing protein At5g60140-like [Capsicum annuum]